MSYIENKKQQQAMAAWLETREFTVFGTLKFTDGFSLHDARGEQLVRQYFCALDRTYYGNAVKNTGMRHNRVVFKHMGTSRENLHYHFLSKPHTDPALFAQLSKKQWAKWEAGLRAGKRLKLTWCAVILLRQNICYMSLTCLVQIAFACQHHHSLQQPVTRYNFVI
jgi:hypothetical protein